MSPLFARLARLAHIAETQGLTLVYSERNGARVYRRGGGAWSWKGMDALDRAESFLLDYGEPIEDREYWRAGRIGA